MISIFTLWGYWYRPILEYQASEPGEAGDARMGLLYLSTTDTRDIYDVGCLIDHHRPNQVNFYTRIRLVLVGFCHPAIPQSIEEDRAPSTEKSSTQAVRVWTRQTNLCQTPTTQWWLKKCKNCRRQSGTTQTVLSPGLASNWSSDDIKNGLITSPHSLTEIRKFSANIFIQLEAWVCQ